MLVSRWGGGTNRAHFAIGGMPVGGKHFTSLHFRSAKRRRAGHVKARSMASQAGQGSRDEGQKKKTKRAWSPGEAARADENRTGRQARGVGNQCVQHVWTRAAACKTGCEGDVVCESRRGQTPERGGGRPYAVLERVGRGHRRPCLLRIGGMPVGGKNFTSLHLLPACFRAFILCTNV